MSGMDGLGDFLLARLAEDEQDARETAGDERHQQWALNESPDYNEGAIVSYALRMLAEVESKRAIIAEVLGWRHSAVVDVGGGFQSCDEGDDCRCGTGERQLAILQPMAAVYAKHPAYREFEWAQ